MDPSDLRKPEAARSLTVFYHGGCPDGVTGAWCVYWALAPPQREALRGLGGIYDTGAGRARRAPGPAFVGLAHGSQRPAKALVAGRHVVCVDITPRAEILRWMTDTAATLVVLDHHRSAEPALLAAQGPRVAVVFDEGRAGAQIAWDWAHGGARPAFVDYVADADLYTWRLPDARAVCKALHVEEVTQGFGPLTDLMAAGGGVEPGLAARGVLYLRYEAQLVARLAATARPARVCAGEGAEAREYRALVVNSAVLQTEIGAAVMAGAGPDVHFAAIWAYIPDHNEVWVSVRTDRDDVDLAALAPRVVGGAGGGGHPRAAGFRIHGSSVAEALRPFARAAADGPR